jgi:hypothetical protein
MLKRVLLLSRRQEAKRGCIGDQESGVEETLTKETFVIISENLIRCRETLGTPSFRK